MPPPLSMEPPPNVDRNAAPAYPTPSSASTPATNSLPSSVPQSAPEPASTSTVMEGRKYSLDIVQEPIRARMCGFGDKDRRPITPPPCIRLLVHEANSPFSEIDIAPLDTSYFVLTVDLWNAEGTKEVNLVRHSQTSPSISAATSASYPPPNVLQNPYGLPASYLSGPAYAPATPQNQLIHNQQQIYSQQQLQHQHQPYSASPMGSYSQHPYQQSQPMYHQQPAMIPSIHSPQHYGYYAPQTSAPMTQSGHYAPHMSHTQSGYMHALPRTIMDPTASTPTPSGMFTRNLIGSLGVSAFKLTDTNNVQGIWFILQDLSVRTEGIFRLKLSFVNVGSTTSATALNLGSAPVLASAFSQPFQVFSAKKFPGVIESTGLSKCFATQGIKIPIRKDGPRGNARGEGDDDEG
ncbi:MAG: hypothetical protein Q9220_002418 [cf. Caloplaca sp. 1 TL-2023]